MSTTFKLSCTNTPGKNLVQTNKVYVSAHDFNTNTYLKVKDCVFIAEPHPHINSGEIALNKIQRQSARISGSELVDCTVFQIPTERFTLNSVTLGMIAFFFGCLLVVDQFFFSSTLHHHFRFQILSIYCNTFL